MAAIDFEEQDPLTTKDDAEKDTKHFQKWQQHLKLAFRSILVLALTSYVVAACYFHPLDAIPILLVYLFFIYRISRPVRIITANYIVRLFDRLPCRCTLCCNPCHSLRHLWDRIPKTYRRFGLWTLLLLCILLAIFLSPETSTGTFRQRLQSLLGLCVFLALPFLLSSNFRLINYHAVFVAVFFQLCFSAFVMKTKSGASAMAWLTQQCLMFFKYSRSGLIFLVGSDLEPSNGTILVALIVPLTIFVSALVEFLYFYGIVQWVVGKIAFIMARLMNTSGSESAVAVVSPFVGLIQMALFVRPYIRTMTASELHSCMTSGFASLTGAFLIMFVAMGANGPAMITASILSAPLGLAVSKIKVPETETSDTLGSVNIVKPPRSTDGEEKDEDGGPVSRYPHEAAIRGAVRGLILCGYLLAALLFFISLSMFTNEILGYLGRMVNIQNLNFQLIIGYLFYPAAWLMGIPSSDAFFVAQQLGTKFFLNELLAFHALFQKVKQGGISERGEIIATFAFSGFASVGSVAIQVACFSTLSKERRNDIAQYAFSALFCGVIVSYITACFAGIMI